jgi:hypothetical protein
MQYLAWPAVVFLLGLVAILVFRRPLSRFIDRAHRIGRYVIEAGPPIQGKDVEIKPSTNDKIAEKGDAKIYSKFGDIPWDELFLTCSNLDILLHYFDSSLNSQYDSLLQILNNGGTIRIILPNYENDGIIKIIKKRFPELSDLTIKEKIKNTRHQLNALLDETTNKKAKVKIYLLDDMIFYAGLNIDNRILIISPFEHNRLAYVEAPALLIYLDRNLVIQRWFINEFDYLIQKAIEK